MSTITDEKNCSKVTEEKKKMVVLKSSDSKEFQVEQSAAIQSITITNMLEECDFSIIPLPNVDSKTLIKVIQYLKVHAGSESSSTEEKISFADSKDVFDLILAANYLNIAGLLDLCCQYIADTIKDFSPEEVRAFFKIKNNFTPDEEAAIRNEYSWAFE